MAGRKPIDKEAITETISIRLSKSEMKRFEELAKVVDLPKTRLMRNVLLTGLEEAEILNKIGALKGAKKLLDFKERFLNTEKYKAFKELQKA